MRRLAANLFILMVMLTLAGNAFAGGVVYSGTRGFEKLQKGLVQIGFDNIMLVNYHNSTETHPGQTIDSEIEIDRTVLNASWIGGITPRYLLMNNFSVGLSLNYFYQLEKVTEESGGTTDETEESDTGFIGFLTANYHLRLGHSLFLRPGVGVGYFMGTRETPGGSGTKIETSLSGLAGQIDLTLEYFASAHFSMRAGPVIMMRFGTETPDGADEGDAYTQIDAGFIGGLGYSF